MAIIYGTSGNDYLTGTEINNRIYGYAGDDTLIGGSGEDYLVGGDGNDILTGGSGTDTFVLNYSGGGIDTITDFSVNDDILEITTLPFPPGLTISSPSKIFLNLIAAVGKNYNILTTNDIAVIGNNYNISTYNGIAAIGNNYNISTYNGADFSYLTYSADTGALFYNNVQQVAWLPTGLDWNQASVVLV
ncbi:MAG: hypothetical protein V7L04_15045 [Nostoc sp.]|uniref:hypothetical protein n=1 Tax=Nostoc sp. TaxID=1180 RepID=UPI002FFC8A7E